MDKDMVLDIIGTITAAYVAGEITWAEWCAQRAAMIGLLS